VREDPLDRDAAAEPLQTDLLCEKHLGHPAPRDPALEEIRSEPDSALGSHHLMSLSLIRRAGIRG